jgi:hypothetical protein
LPPPSFLAGESQNFLPQLPQEEGEGVRPAESLRLPCFFSSRRMDREGGFGTGTAAGCAGLPGSRGIRQATASQECRLLPFIIPRGGKDHGRKEEG